MTRATARYSTKRDDAPPPWVDVVAPSLIGLVSPGGGWSHRTETVCERLIEAFHGKELFEIEAPFLPGKERWKSERKRQQVLRQRIGKALSDDRDHGDRDLSASVFQGSWTELRERDFDQPAFRWVVAGHDGISRQRSLSQDAKRPQALDSRSEHNGPLRKHERIFIERTPCVEQHHLECQQVIRTLGIRSPDQHRQGRCCWSSDLESVGFTGPWSQHRCPEHQ